MEQGVANKIVIVAGGADSPGCGIVKVLLQSGATVIVPVADSASIHRLRGHAGDTVNLITYPTDFGDYEKAEELIDIIVSEYGNVDLVVSAIEKMAGHSPLLYADIKDWQKTIDCNITSSFVIDRLCIPLLGKNGGVLINISNADHLLLAAGSPLARLSGYAGIELSKAFGEEAKPHNIHYYHLLINNLSPVAAGNLQEGEREITPGMIGEEVMRLYSLHKQLSPDIFQFFTGKPLDADLLNRLKGQ